MSPFVRPRPVIRPRVRLVVFHHAGGSAALYYPLIRQLPADWDLAILDLPGRGKRHAQEPLSSMAQVMPSVLSDLEPLLDAPLALFGHSYGALVASEVAFALARGLHAPVWLGISGRAAPTLRARPEALASLDDEALLHTLVSLGGTPPRIREFPEFIARFLRLARADLMAVESYRARPHREPLHCPLVAYAGRDDPHAPPESMLHWAQMTQQRFEQRVFEGGHFYFMGDAFAGFARQVISDIQHVGLCDANQQRAASPVPAQALEPQDLKQTARKRSLSTTLAPRVSATAASLDGPAANVARL